jgi:hypothetical protein
VDAAAGAAAVRVPAAGVAEVAFTAAADAADCLLQGGLATTEPAAARRG